MCENHGDFFNLAERIEDSFAEIDSDVVTELADSDDEYAAMEEKAKEIKQEYPMIENVLNGSGAISLTAAEHEALVQYADLTRQMEDAERKAIYFRGHTDCFAYLKKIGAI